MDEIQNLMHWIIPAIYIIGGLLVGFVLEKIVLAELRHIAKKTKWKGDIVIINSLRGMVMIWLLIAGIYGAILSIPMSPSLLAHLKQILLVVVILSGTIVIAKMTAGFVSIFVQREDVALPSTSIFRNLAKLLVFVIGIMVILQSLGISITPILTALGVGGLAAALALQPTLANLFSGLQIIAAKQLHPGDYIKLDSGEEGYVTDVTWRNTTIRALKNNMIIIPNSKLASTIVKNYYQPQQEMSFLVQVGVSYDSDLQKVEKVTIEVGKEVMRGVEGGVPEFEPLIRYHTFDDSSINFTVVLRTKEYVGQYLLKHEFIKRLHERYDKEGISIPFPIRTIQMEKEKK
ncbi:MAG: mechanosensitive ion channel family protein [Deltaproteobacteria bacterium]|nr:mechanosensitive ion channel family protein [Deltaproteobacteria bacterium]